MSESAQTTPDAIEEELQADLGSSRFDQYVLVTWNVDEVYLQQLDTEDTAVVCGPEKNIVETVEAVNRESLS